MAGHSGSSFRCPGYRCGRNRSSADLVEKFVYRVADLLEPLGFHHRQIWTGNIPEVRRDLVPHNEILYLWATNPWPTFDFTELKIQDVGDLGAEVIDVGIPVAVVSAGEQHLRVVVQKDPAHVVNSANQVHVSIAEVAMQALKMHACASLRQV